MLDNLAQGHPDLMMENSVEEMEDSDMIFLWSGILIFDNGGLQFLL